MQLEPASTARSESERLKANVQLVSDALDSWSDYHEEMSRELDRCLKFKHYRDDPGNDDKPSRVKPKGRQLWATTRHKAAQISRSEIYFDVRPVDRELDPAMADIVRGVMEQEIHNPLKQYEHVRDMVALYGLAARMGYARLDWCPEVGEFGEVLPGFGDGRDLMWAPNPTNSPHDPRCAWVLELRRVSPDAIQRMRGWRNKSGVIADNGRPVYGESATDGRGLVEFDRSAAPPRVRDTNVTDFATLAFLWERNKPARRGVRKAGSRELPPEDAYLQCSDLDGHGCGYRSKTLAEAMEASEAEADAATPWPEVIVGACPDCGSDLRRVDTVAGGFVYSSKHSLTIFAPFQSLEFWHGPWPFNMRSVPYLRWECYPSPIDPIGQSETSVNWTQLQAHNLVMRLGLEHMLLAKPYYAVSRGAKDYQGEPWQFGELQGLGIYFDPLEYGAHEMRVLQANGLPPAWATLEGRLDSALRQDMGTNDLSFSQDRTRDIPVGTIQAMERVQELPIDHQINRFRHEESIYFGVWFDIWKETATEARMVRYYGEEGRMQLQMLRGLDLPNVDLVVTANPALAKVDGDVIEKFAQLFQMPPETWEFMARRLNVPAFEIRELLQKVEQAKAEQAASMAGVAGPGAAPGQQMVATPADLQFAT